MKIITGSLCSIHNSQKFFNGFHSQNIFPQRHGSGGRLNLWKALRHVPLKSWPLSFLSLSQGTDRWDLNIALPQFCFSCFFLRFREILWEKKKSWLSTRTVYCKIQHMTTYTISEWLWSTMKIIVINDTFLNTVHPLWAFSLDVLCLTGGSF